MKKQIDFSIYALIADRKVFIGKTKAEDLKPIRWRHLRGENKYTEEHFARELGADVQIHILARVHTDFQTAFRYTIAFANMFLRAGFSILNGGGVWAAANEVHALTQNIIDELERRPISYYLEREADDWEEPQGVASAPEPKHTKKTRRNPTVKLTVRITPEDKQWLADFAKKLGITQGQAMQLLVTKQKIEEWKETDWSFDGCVEYLVKNHREENRRLKEENEELKRQLREQKKEEITVRSDIHEIHRKGLFRFYSLFHPMCAGNQHLPQGSFKVFRNSLPDPELYRYPKEEGLFLFYPERILEGEGRGKAIFIVGEDERGRRTMVRFYPKKSRLGLSFGNTKFGLQGSAWLVGVKKSRDGAMDVLFSLPVDILREGCAEPARRIESDVNRLIEDAIKRAQWENADF